MNIDALLEELYAYSMFSIRLGLDNIKEICKYLGNPQNSYKVIHITGTNGKGSVSTTVERILLEAGYKVGKYTSPHILEFNERISFNDKYISNEDVAKYYEKVKKLREIFEAECVEMEGAAVAHVCEVMNIPFIVIRSISDKADDEAGMTFDEFVKIAAKHSKSIVEGILSIMK